MNASIRYLINHVQRSHYMLNHTWKDKTAECKLDVDFFMGASGVQIVRLQIPCTITRVWCHWSSYLLGFGLRPAAFQ